MRTFKRNYARKNSIDEIKHEIIHCYLNVCLLLGEHLLATKEEDLDLKEVAKRLNAVLYLVNK